MPPKNAPKSGAVNSGFPLILPFFERVPEVRDTLRQTKFFKILIIEMKNYSHHNDNGNVRNRSSMDIYLFNTNYKLIRQNIDICTVNRDNFFLLNLVIWGTFYGVIYGWQADFRNIT
jgi:hypothetical protein